MNITPPSTLQKALFNMPYGITCSHTLTYDCMMQAATRYEKDSRPWFTALRYSRQCSAKFGSRQKLATGMETTYIDNLPRQIA